MSKGNKSVREELERLYGSRDMFKAARIEDQIDEINKVRKKKIKTYREFKEKTHYKASKKKSLERLLSLHHLKHKAEDGETSIENGVVVAALPHSYLHSLPRDEEEIINNMLRDYKNGMVFNFAKFSDEGIREPHQITFEEMGIGYETITLEDNTEEDLEFLQLSEEEQEEYEKRKAELRKKAYSRFPKKEPQRGKSHIDPEWQREIMQDVIDEMRY